MPVDLVPVSPGDMEEMAAVFNHYVEYSLATYTETPVSVDMFGSLMSFTSGYPAFAARDTDGSLAGFCLLRPYSPIPAFAATAELSCFLNTGYTGRGIGSMMLRALEDEAAASGISTIIATVSSLNTDSLRFHLARGFVERGRFEGIGVRNGLLFDVVLLQKNI